MSIERFLLRAEQKVSGKHNRSPGDESYLPPLPLLLYEKLITERMFRLLAQALVHEKSSSAASRQ